MTTPSIPPGHHSRQSLSPKVVVTGGAGFIGSHLATELVRRGYHVVILDDLSTGKLQNIAHLIDPETPDAGAPQDISGAAPSENRGGRSATTPDINSLEAGSTSRLRGSQETGAGPTGAPQNIAGASHPNPNDRSGHAAGPGTCVFVRGSVTDLPALTHIFDGAAYIFHQAAIPSVPRSIDDPLSTHHACATGTLNVLIAARDAGAKKVVYASSSSVYGDTPTLPKREDMIPQPLSPYAITKLAGEHYCQVFHRIYGLATVSLRYFNVYGPRQDPTSAYAAVMPRFVSRLQSGQPPVIFGDGEQTRDFTYIADTVEANVLAAESPEATGVYNVATGSRITLNDLARMIIGLVAEAAPAGLRDRLAAMEPEYAPERPGDIKHSLADISRAAGFGYRPRYDIAAGLKETVAGLGKE